MTDKTPLLFQPLQLRGITLPNRIVIPPMCMYSAEEGFPTDFHMVHLGKFALGGAGMVILEVTAVTRDGRITHGDLGIWDDEHAAKLAPLAAFLKSEGTVPAIQIGHSGRKGSMQRPWKGNGPLTPEDIAAGDTPWQPEAPSAVPLADGWLTPRELDLDDMKRLRTAFADATKRAVDAGFESVELHCAHGYLLQTFLSPLGNFRNDAYGGDLEGRMRLPLEIAEDVRAALPDNLPLFVRISSVDAIEGGWEMEDSLVFAKELKDRGVDVIDCSSGGQTPKGATNFKLNRTPGYQVPYAAEIRRDVGIMTQAVGLITDPHHAEEILQAGDADLIAIGREALYNPFWPRHAADAFKLDEDFEHWPPQYGWWLQKRAQGQRAQSQD